MARARQDDCLRCKTCGYTCAWFNGWDFSSECFDPGRPGLHVFEIHETHTAAFAEFSARRSAERAVAVSVSWRKVDPITGGGYSGLASTGERVYVVRRDTMYEYGRVSGKAREAVGVEDLLSRAKLAAEQLLSPAAILAANPKEDTMSKVKTPEFKRGELTPFALDAIVAVFKERGVDTLEAKEITAAVAANTGLSEKSVYGALTGNHKKGDAAVVLRAERKMFKLTPAGKAKASGEPEPVPPVEEVAPDSPAVTPGAVVLADPLKAEAKPDAKPARKRPSRAKPKETSAA